MKKKLLIKIRTIKKAHVVQLPYIHNWDGTYPWHDKKILGRSVTDGFILVEDRQTGELARVAPIALIDVFTLQAGGKLPSAEYNAIPQLFLD